MKLKDRYNEILSESITLNDKCDCCKYFDMKSLYQYVEFEKPLYSFVQKRKTARLIYMEPKQYIYQIAQNFGGLSYDDTVNYGSNVGEEQVKKYAEDMKNGDKFPIPWYNKDNDLQEGRHRALATMINGCKLIPVIEFSSISDEDFIKWIQLFKGKSKEELNDTFTELGFEKGMGDLGYSDLQRFIQYNL